MKVSEIFYSIQGEGKSAGRPAIFVRLAGCNLRCKWCDSKYAWSVKDAKEYDVSELYLGILARRFTDMPTDFVVITGGEPLLQQEEVLKLINKFYKVSFEIETNGTIKLKDIFEWKKHKRKITFNISPKLSNSGNSEKARYPKLLETVKSAHLDYIVKFVIGRKKDFSEVEEIIKMFNIPRKRVWLMPLGATRTAYSKNMKNVVEYCLKEGYNFSPRLQIEIWNNKRGV